MKTCVYKSWLAPLILIATASSANASLLVNGNFEFGNLTGGVPGGFGPFLTFDEGSSGLEGWTVGPGGVNLWTDYNGTGNHVIDIIGDTVDGGGSLSQSFATIVGQQYTITFDLSGADNPDLTDFNNPIKEMDVTVFGSDSVSVIAQSSFVEDTSGWDGAFMEISLSFVADGSVSTLEFYGFNSGWNGFYIDNVDVSAVPIPAALWMFSAALVSLVRCAKKRC